jgi:hypothetical protein
MEARRRADAERRVSPPPAPPPPAAGPGGSPAGSPPPASASPRPPVKDETEATATAALAPLTEKLSAAASKLAQDLTPTLDGLVNPPKQDIRVLRESATSIDDARGRLTTFIDELKSMDAAALAATKSAGLSEADATFHAGRWGSTAKIMPRVFAAEGLLKTLDHAKTEAELLRDNITKWKRGKDGKIESKDKQLENDVNSARFFLGADLKRRREALEQIQGR